MSDTSAVQPASTGLSARDRAGRAEAIDLLRGLVIVIMVLDHARDFFHAGALAGEDPLDVEQTTVALYATRWVTHLCAPVFVLLAGVSAWMRGQSVSRGELSVYLLTRGLWLVFIEVTFIHWFGWWFAFEPARYKLQVISAIGLSMVMLGGLVWLPRWSIAAFGLALVFGHNLFDAVGPGDVGALAPLWSLLHEPSVAWKGASVRIIVSYPLVPWVGVMAIGYSLGPLMRRRVEARRRWLGWLAVSAMGLFGLLRGANLYGDTRPWKSHGDLLASAGDLLDVRKYPPSLAYLLITLAIGLLLWRWFERGTPRPMRWMLAFGATPMFTYLVHIPLLHAMSVLAHELAIGDGGFLVGARHLHYERPVGAGFGLGVTYGAWMVALLLLYPLVRWMASLKRRRKDWWLGYL